MCEYINIHSVDKINIKNNVFEEINETEVPV